MKKLNKTQLVNKLAAHKQIMEEYRNEGRTEASFENLKKAFNDLAIQLGNLEADKKIKKHNAMIKRFKLEGIAA